MPTWAATGDNVDRLEQSIIGRLPEGERLYPDDYLTDQPERFFAAEVVREKLLQFTHAEIPFSSAVVIDRFEESATPSPEDAEGNGAAPAALASVVARGSRVEVASLPTAKGASAHGGRAPREKAKGLLRLFCTIVVDRESQKPIVIGKGGDMIKKIGIAAREELERFFATRVFLDLHVRVRSEWREDERVLSEIGLGVSGHDDHR